MRILCIDFDGVIHSYTNGWQGQTVINDPPVKGALEFLRAAAKEFRVMIFSSRSTNQKGIDAMQRWLVRHYNEAFGEDEKDIADIEAFVHVTLEWPTEKPPAFVTLDDRALTFKGEWPTLESLNNFMTWQQIEKETNFKVTEELRTDPDAAP